MHQYRATDVPLPLIDTRRNHSKNAAKLKEITGPKQQERLVSNRDIEILLMIASGYHMIDIANTLGIAYRTTQHHISRMYERYEETTQTALVMKALFNGDIQPWQIEYAWSKAHDNR